MTDLCYNCGHRGVSQIDPNYKFLALCHNCDQWHLPDPCQQDAVYCYGCNQIGHQVKYCPRQPLAQQRIAAAVPTPPPQSVEPMGDPPEKKRKATKATKGSKAAKEETEKPPPNMSTPAPFRVQQFFPQDFHAIKMQTTNAVLNLVMQNRRFDEIWHIMNSGVETQPLANSTQAGIQQPLDPRPVQAIGVNPAMISRAVATPQMSPPYLPENISNRYKTPEQTPSQSQLYQRQLPTIQTKPETIKYGDGGRSGITMGHLNPVQIKTRAITVPTEPLGQYKIVEASDGGGNIAPASNTSIVVRSDTTDFQLLTAALRATTEPAANLPTPDSITMAALSASDPASPPSDPAQPNPAPAKKPAGRGRGRKTKAEIAAAATADANTGNVDNGA